jgi:hypothetical protein
VVATTYNTALQQCVLPVDVQAFVNLITFGETKTTFKARPHCGKPRTLVAILTITSPLCIKPLYNEKAKHLLTCHSFPNK